LNLSRLRSRHPLWLILSAFIILALIYAWATPPLEASDELWHFGMVNYIAETGQLPVQVPDVKTPYEQEGSQPPLYYLIAAVLVKPIDRSDFMDFSQPNPHAVAGIPGNIGNKNLVLHDTPHPLLERTAFAVYILRLFSIVLGCITVFAVYNAARQLTPDNATLPILAAGLTAFNPMFLFITASVNNDNLVTALNSLIIWQMLVMLREMRFSTRRSLLIAVLIALASLSKLSGLVLVPVVALAALWITFFPSLIRKESVNFGGLFTLGLAMMFAWLLLASWWYIRNLTLYGELFGTHTMALVAGVREGGFTLQTLLNEFQGFRFGYWAVFGAYNIMTFRWFYDVMDILTVFAISGLLIYFWKQTRQPESRLKLISPVLLVLIILIGLTSVTLWTAQTYASQGRLLFPFVAAISPLLVLGLVTLTKLIFFRISSLLVTHYSPLRTQYSVLSTFLCFVFAFIVPFATIAPEYTPPVSLERLPDSAQQVYARFGDVALIGYETPNRRYLPGDYAPVTVYWQVLESSSADLSLYLHATMDDGTVIGKVDSYPGGGRLRTTTWQIGAIYADSYAIPLDSTVDFISRLRVQVGWWNYQTEQLVEAVDSNDQPLQSIMLNAGGFAPQTVMPLPDNLIAVPSVSFGGIRLVGYILDGNNLTLAWESSGELPADYTIFVQVLDENNGIAGQGDAPPALPTSDWRSGERFLTHHTITYSEPPPAGDYHLVIGWYNPDGFARLDTAAPDDAYPLTTIIFP